MLPESCLDGTHAGQGYTEICPVCGRNVYDEPIQGRRGGESGESVDRLGWGGVTAEWLETFKLSKAKGENLADSVFWRLALTTLPEGVDPNNPEVQAAIREIRKMCQGQAVYHLDEGIYQGGRPDSWEFFDNSWAIVCLEESNTIPGDADVNCSLHMPIVDGLFPGITWLRTVVKIVEAMRGAGYKVYIHCRGGISRSTMVAAAYLMKKHNYDADTALEVIAAVNTKLDPAPAFIKGLKEWYKDK